ncbi:AbrB family transcriptional regulator [Lederbergia sp. NSJ-179]|uniref:AbrB family transcriptional regulator n=1 Tax=Lederbergia sp. NSJ-179 TaxID=2931402 RepID=UPI001FCF8E7B|nr:AbrB family transcriptional regulator [Lederbergia sp. NSJ-179]MCJ7842037.1 AbrB family transcriptional regulator [Lederbergia sp. NSJ-179]
MQFKKMIFTFLIAAIGGGVFQFLHIPVPWLLGPMISVLLAINLLHWQLVWPNSIRNSGMIIVGYTIGLSMTSSALHEMGRQIPYMLLMTVLLLLFCSVIAYVVSKISNSDYQTALLASIPGGLSQVLILAEETKGINLGVVTMTQVIRLLMIIVATPLIVMLPIFREAGGSEQEAIDLPAATSVSWAHLFPNLLLFAIVCVGMAFICIKIKMPTAYLIGPAIGTAVLQAFGMEGPLLPSALINLAQLMIGTYVGLLLRPNDMPHKFKSLCIAIGSGLMLVIGGIGLGWLLTIIQPVSKATGLLSLAPGGMDQMGIIAHAIHADLYIVSGYQLFRTFFIFFAVPPFVKWLFKRMDRRKADEESVLIRRN